MSPTRSTAAALQIRGDGHAAGVRRGAPKFVEGLGGRRDEKNNIGRAGCYREPKDTKDFRDVCLTRAQEMG